MHELDALKARAVESGLRGICISHQETAWHAAATQAGNRFESLTGFSGSSGNLLVWESVPHLFVDSRYYEAARQQELPCQIHLQQTDEMARFLREQAQSGDKVGFLAPSYSVKQIRQLVQSCPKADFIPCGANIFPLPDRPFVGRDLFVHSDRFTGETASNRIQLIRQRLANSRRENFLLTNPDSIAWLLNLRGQDLPFTPLPLCQALLTTDECLLFLSTTPTETVRSYLRHSGIRLVDNQCWGQHLLDLKAKEIGIDPCLTSAATYKELELAGLKIFEFPDPCQLARSIKTEHELHYLHKAGVQDSVAWCELLAWLERQITSGPTELEVAKKLETLRCIHPDYSGPSFPTISATGMNSAYPHYASGHTALRSNEIYLLDAGSHYPGGTTDITRTIAFPTVEDETTRFCFTQVLRAHIALAQAVFPRATKGKHLDSLAREVLLQQQLDCPHSIGHGVDAYGSVHAAPSISPNADNKIKAGMVITDEPGCYFPGKYGIRLENMYSVVNSETGNLTLYPLTFVPFARNLIIKQALREEEIDWLNSYHSRVRELIAPRLRQNTTRTWLDKACSPL